jgi:hypothetical protein
MGCFRYISVNTLHKGDDDDGGGGGGDDDDDDDDDDCFCKITYTFYLSISYNPMGGNDKEWGKNRLKTFEIRLLRSTLPCKRKNVTRRLKKSA